jgi:hypothetical protein
VWVSGYGVRGVEKVTGERNVRNVFAMYAMGS